MLNNAFFNIVFYNVEPLNYTSKNLYKSLDTQSYEHTTIDIKEILDDIKVLDTLHFSVAENIPDIYWEYQYVGSRIQNYYNALIKMCSLGFKTGILKRINVFYPFVRTAYNSDASLHGSTIYTFITEIIYNDNQSILCVSEEIPDDFDATKSFEAAETYAERMLFDIRNSSFCAEKYKYYDTELYKGKLFIVNYMLAEFLGINLKINIRNSPFRVIVVSNRCNLIESCDYKGESKFKFTKSNSIILLNNSKGKNYDDFAYKAYSKFFSYITFLDSQNKYLKYSIAANCLSQNARIFAHSLRKYIHTQEKILKIKPIKNVDAMIREHKEEMIKETAKELIKVSASATGAFLSNYNP